MSFKSNSLSQRLVWNLFVVALGLTWMAYDPSRALGGIVVVVVGLVALLKGRTALQLLKGLLPRRAQQQEETQRYLDDYDRVREETIQEDQRRRDSADSLCHREVMRSLSDENP